MFLTLQNIQHQYNNEPVLQHVNLQLQANTTLGILGKSGCGKTTLLKIIAGIIPIQVGEIILQNNNINTTPPHLRNIVYMSQEALLFPHLNVFENIAFGLRIRKENNTQVQQKVTALLTQLSLAAHAQKMPHQLSGGQKQRVNFGRALIINPPLLLLDEPFGNLDTHTRAEMQLLFKEITSNYNMASIFVTHDVKEALLVANDIGYMNNGHLKIYANQQAFIDDDITGAKNEMAFWKNVSC
ncbi:ABC transporter ATP-binding protein [Ferruginibacter yonginensis]|uniref:ABC transporter ATP-binding protein n=1 Tax=Ferruginibacter yonginensis TaxID=1310416 RepID=A0ABV8QRL8_9BACT